MNASLHALPLLADLSEYWKDTFFGLDATQRFVLMIVAIGCVTGIICTIVGVVSTTVGSMHRHRLDAEMKRDMLDRGMTADEISKVVEASQPKDFLERWACQKKKTA
jgi:hypothetical protein